MPDTSYEPSSDAAELTSRSIGDRTHSVRRERLITAVAAGTLVVLWFLLFDGLTAGTPLHTVERVGAALAKLGDQKRWSPPLATSLVFFCLLHYGVWLANASLVLGVVHRGRKHPTILVPAVLLIAIFFLPFVAFITMFVELGWGSGSWVRFIVGALIGNVTVAVLAYRAHRTLVRYELAHLDDDEE